MRICRDPHCSAVYSQFDWLNKQLYNLLKTQICKNLLKGSHSLCGKPLYRFEPSFKGILSYFADNSRELSSIGATMLTIAKVFIKQNCHQTWQTAWNQTYKSIQCLLKQWFHAKQQKLIKYSCLIYNTYILLLYFQPNSNFKY